MTDPAIVPHPANGRPAVITLTQLPDFVTVDELGQLLRVGRSLAYALVARGEVRAIRCGRVLRIPKSAVLALLERAE